MRGVDIKDNMLALIYSVEYQKPINKSLRHVGIENSVQTNLKGKINHELRRKIKNLHSQGYNDNEIAKFVNRAAGSVRSQRIKMGLESNHNRQKTNKKISESRKGNIT